MDFSQEEITITEIALACVTKSGRNEENIIDDYERRCRRHKIVPLYGQLKTALKSLFKDGAVFFKVVGGKKLLCKR